MAGRLANKVAVITGIGDGMGRTAALRFAAEGASIIGCDINAETAADTLRLVRDAGGAMECLSPLDLSDEAETHRLMTQAVESFGRIDILYNNAMSQRLGTSESVPLEDWNFTLTHALTIGLLATKHAIPYMRDGGGGAIIFIGSGIGLPVGTGMPGNTTCLFPYTVAKAGVIAMAHAMAIEFAPYNVRVNSICPGPIQTPASRAMFGEEGTDLRRLFEKPTLVGRLGVPDDIVNAALFLASDESSFISGETFRVDGGWVASGGVGRPDPTATKAIHDVVGESIVTDDQWEFDAPIGHDRYVPGR